VYEVNNMQIEGRTSDIAQGLLTGSGSVPNRQRSGTSDPSGKASKTTEQSQGKAVPSNNPGLPGSGKTEVADLDVTVEKLNKVVQDQHRDVAFSVDQDANTTVIKIFKSTTGELIKQFPPEEILAMKAKLRKTTGWLVDKKV
jgi:flagellar protein FlaG